MKSIGLLILGFYLPGALSASEAQLIDEKTIQQWGYSTLSSSPHPDYHAINDLEGETSLRYQGIKSKKPVKGMANTYYYFSLSEECFSNKFKAIKRRLSLGLLDDKDYRLGEIDGNCVRIVDTAAKFGTFEEQPRIHRLFNEYLDQKE